MPLSNTSFAYFSIENSTLIPLGANETYTGKWEDVSQFSVIYSLWRTDADGDLVYQFSIDGQVVDRQFPTHTTNLGDGNYVSTGPRARYFRMVYINRGHPQSILRIQTIYSTNPIDDGHSPLSSGLGPKTNSIAARSLVYGLIGNNVVPLRLNSDGSLITHISNQPTPLTPNFKTNKITTSDLTPDQVILSQNLNHPTSLLGFSVYVWDTMSSNNVVFGEASLESPAGSKLYTAQLTSMGMGKAQIEFGGPIGFPANQEIRLVCTPSAPINNQRWQGNLIGAA